METKKNPQQGESRCEGKYLSAGTAKVLNLSQTAKKNSQNFAYKESKPWGKYSMKNRHFDFC